MTAQIENKSKSELLNEISIEILSLLSVEQINEQVYSRVNKLMDAAVFGIGVFNAENKKIVFPAYLEKGVKMPFEVFLSESAKLAVKCFDRQQLIVINSSEDLLKYFEKAPAVVVGEITQSVLYAPLIFKGAPLGVITVQSFKDHAYSEADVQMISNLSVYVSTAIHNARIYESSEALVQQRSAELFKQKEELEKAYQNTRLLSEIGQKIVASLSVESIIDDTYNSVKGLMDAEIFGIAVVNDSDTRFLDFFVTEYDKKLPNVKLDLLDTLRPGAICYNEQITVFFNDFDQEIKTISPDYIKPIQGRQAGSLIYLPLTRKEKKIGVITVQNYKTGVFTPQHLDILQTLAIYVTSAIENALLYSGMEKEVSKRTQELSEQKREVENAYQHIQILDEVGQQITSTLNFEIIFETLHKNVSQLMSAEVFGIRLYHKEKNEIEIKYEIDKGVRDDGFSIPADNPNSFSVWCIRNKKEVFFNDQEHEYIKYIAEKSKSIGDPTPSSIFCPILSGDHVLGILTVQSYKKNQYTNQHLHILKTLANYASIALENASKYEKLNLLHLQVEESYKQINILSSVGQQITATLEIDTILDVVFENISGLMDATEFGVGICRKEENVLDVSHYIYEGKKISEPGVEALVPLDSPGRLSAWCVKNKKEVFIGEMENEFSHYIPNLDAYRKNGILLLNSLICLPLLIENEVIGVISVQSPNKKAYTRQHLGILQALATYAAIALENALVYKKLDFALHEVERLSVVASKTNNTVIICKPDTEIEWANEAFVRNSGYTLEEFRVKKGKSLIEISGRKEIRGLVDECIREKSSVIYESVNLSRNGKNIWYQTTLTPIFNEAGILLNIVAIDADITRIKEAETELIRKNKSITDSINYAKKIQNSILPAEVKIHSLLKEFFILYKPRDIVSGDFYWVEQLPGTQNLIIAVVDCTGHGVPGAFLTIVGNSLLHQIVIEQKTKDPAEIIRKMNEGIITRLSFTGLDKIRDGMDMAVCVIEKNEFYSNVYYAGAFNPVYFSHLGILGETLPCRASVGSMDRKLEEEVHTQCIKLDKGEMLYMFTDGFADQLGETSDKKFLKSRFKQLLLDVCISPPAIQKETLEKTMEQWKGQKSQTDDMLVIGMRI